MGYLAMTRSPEPRLCNQIAPREVEVHGWMGEPIYHITRLHQEKESEGDMVEPLVGLNPVNIITKAIPHVSEPEIAEVKLETLVGMYPVWSIKKELPEEEPEIAEVKLETLVGMYPVWSIKKELPEEEPEWTSILQVPEQTTFKQEPLVQVVKTELPQIEPEDGCDNSALERESNMELASFGRGNIGERSGESLTLSSSEYAAAELACRRTKAIVYLRKIIDCDYLPSLTSTLADSFIAKTIRKQNRKPVPSQHMSSTHSSDILQNVCEKFQHHFTRSVRIQKLKLHELKGWKNTESNCKECGKDFILPSALKNHKMLNHLNDYICETCRKCINGHFSFQNHLRVHSGRKGYKCDVCEEFFKLHEKLKSNLRFSYAKESHECQECGICFTQRDHLNTHLQIHAYFKSYTCEKCGKSFTQRSNLKNHLKLHAVAKS